jgi:predicted nucleic acid-binding protein
VAGRVVVDANILFRALVMPPPNPYQDLLLRWQTDSTELVAPTLIRYEIANALWQEEKNKALVAAESDLALRLFNALQVRVDDDPADQETALAFARRYQMRGTYDPHYLAVAQRLDCDFWTADLRLFNSVNAHLNWVRMIEI